MQDKKTEKNNENSKEFMKVMRSDPTNLERKNRRLVKNNKQKILLTENDSSVGEGYN